MQVLSPNIIQDATAEAIRRTSGRPELEPTFQQARQLIERGYRHHADGWYFKDGGIVNTATGLCRSCGPALTCKHELAVRILAVAFDQLEQAARRQEVAA